MNCVQIQDLFTDRLDNTLDEQSLQFERHLSSCPSCQAEWEVFQQTVALLRELPVEAPADLLAGVRARLESPSPLARLLRFLRETDFSIPLPAAAAIAFMIMTGGFLLRMGVIEQQGASQPGVPAYTRMADLSRPAHQPIPVPRYASTRGSYPPALGIPGLIGRFTPPRFHDVRSSVPTAEGSLRQGLSGEDHPPRSRSITAVSPDLTISVKGINTGDRMRLLHSLMLNDNWPIGQYGPDGVLIRIKPGELPLLYHLLPAQQAGFSPHGAGIMALGSDRDFLTVALVIK